MSGYDVDCSGHCDKCQKACAGWAIAERDLEELKRSELEAQLADTLRREIDTLAQLADVTEQRDAAQRVMTTGWEELAEARRELELLRRVRWEAMGYVDAPPWERPERLPSLEEALKEVDALYDKRGKT